MMPCTRGEPPELLARHGGAIAAQYAQRRTATPAHPFRWPQRDGQSLLTAVRDALRAMTNAHCSYCDGHPIDATGEEQIDHFRPKTDPRFYALVCEWTNLFLACQACNRAKREQWDPALLRPDAADFRFERYFQYRFDTGKLEPNGAASAEDQHRAQCTIDIRALNRPGACSNRRRAVGLLMKGTDEPLRDLAYRFLAPLCLPAE